MHSFPLRKSPLVSAPFVLGLLCLLAAGTGYGQTINKLALLRSPRSDNNTPNRIGLILSDKLSGLMLTPSGWGSNRSFGFVSLGGTPNQLYGSIPDLALRAGVGIGDSRKTVSVVGIVNVNDVSALTDFRLANLSYSFIASRALGKWNSISAGGLHLFANPNVSDGIASGYIAYSHGFGSLRQVTPGNPRLSVTVGIGSGAFYSKSELDVEKGLGHYGTGGLFGSVSYEAVKNLSLNTEWTGINLGLTTAYRLPHNLAMVYAGVANLTRYSGDSPTFVFGVGRAFGFGK